jgi:predicted 3-demethylubiquinone-9 3-methyltransferase (glyoxalase superfamily)
MQKITPCLWFDGQAEEAARFYTSVFKGSKILGVARYGRGSRGKPGSVLTVRFRILGQDFIALNAGPKFKFTPAVSFVVNCRSQAEIDYYWRRLSAGGRKVECGWLVDKYGLSWQVVPDMIAELVADDDPARSERVIIAVMKMVKLDIKRLRRAAAGK